MAMVKQYSIYWVSLDPTFGSEIKKTRPCVVLSPDISNKHLNTVLVAPLTSTIRNFPMRMNMQIDSKKGQIAFDQLRCVDKKRITDKLATLNASEQKEAKALLKEYLID